MLPTLVIFGDKTASEVLEAATLAHSDSFSTIERLYYEEPGFTDLHVPRLNAIGSEIYFHVGVVNIKVKQQIHFRCQALGWTPFTILHPTAFVSPSAKIGKGVFVGPQAVISTNADVGDFSIIHIHASVGHDSKIGNYTAVLPGARISGSCSVGDRVLIGSNAFINAGIKIANDCQVDALTYAVRDLREGYLLSVRSRIPVKRILEN